MALSVERYCSVLSTIAVAATIEDIATVEDEPASA